MQEPSPLLHAFSTSPVSPCRPQTVAKLLVAGVFGVGVTAASFVSTQLRTSSGPYLRKQDFRMLQEADIEECSLQCCQASYQDQLCPTENEWISAIPFSIQIILIVILLGLSALFSGLTLGLMSLDITGLEIVMSGDDPTAAAHAKAIYPVRENGNLLLCTLLLGNVAVNALLSIFLAAYAGGLMGFLISTFLIVIFGEILPQALCSRYALRIGSLTVPMVKVIRCLLIPLAAPLAVSF
jgi:hypothetical protein